MPAIAALDKSAPAEFDRQIDTLARLGYPEIPRPTLDGLRHNLDDLYRESDVDPDDHIPFVVVMNDVPLDSAAERMQLNGKPATLMLQADELARFRPIAGIETPAAYLLTDIDVGAEFANVPPRDALPVITGRGRTPLTIAEGIAVVTLRPDMLRKNKCFSLAGSRCGDSRVPAVWISQRAPKLGWCWNGAPHTWLGVASAGGRR